MKWRVLLILVVCFSVVLLFGGVGFHFLEQANERKEWEEFEHYLEEFVADHPCVTSHRLGELINRVSRAYDQGVLTHHPDHPVPEPGPAENSPLDPVLEPGGSNWDFGGSVFFAGGVATTIGYGNITPATPGGRLFCVLFACVSIPLTLVLVASIGNEIKEVVYDLDRRIRSRNKKRWMGRSLQTILFAGLGVLLFLVLPAIVFMQMESWSYRDALYFCFITLTTIGFGDYVAGSIHEQPYRLLYRLLTWIWIMLGLSWLSTLISLVQDVLTNVVHRVDRGTHKQKFIYNEAEEYRGPPPHDTSRDIMLGLHHRPPGTFDTAPEQNSDLPL